MFDALLWAAMTVYMLSPQAKDATTKAEIKRLAGVWVIESATWKGLNLDHFPDDFGKPTNAFLLCTFWYIDALASVGRRDEALELFNNLLARRNHVGLLSEDIDPRTGELWGNFPQTYSQVGLILSAMRLSRSWEEGLWHAS